MAATLPFTLPAVLGSGVTTETVFTIAGSYADPSFMTYFLQGEVTDGKTVVPIDYPNDLISPEADILTGVEMLNDELTSTAGPKVVFGMSLGSVVAARWLHDYGPTSSIPPSQLTFILCGNSVRRYGGYYPSNDYALYGQFPDYISSDNIIPINTPYDVRDIAIQYDGWVDWPADHNNMQAVAAAQYGQANLHTGYTGIPLDRADYSEYVEGNITYVLVPTNMWWQPDYVLDDIEAGYARPYTTTPEATPPTVPDPPPPPPTVAATVEQPLAPLDPLNEQLLHGDLISRAQAADELAKDKPAVDKTWIVTVYDKWWTPIGELGADMMEMSGTDPRNNCPSATIKIKGESEHIEKFMACADTLVGITVETAGLRLPFYVKTFDYEFKSGEWVGTANCLGVWDILNYYQIWPNFLLPLQAQIPSHAIFIWALCTVVETMVAECALRLQSGLWSFVNNLGSLNLDWRTWFGTLLQSNGNIFEMLKTPMYVVHTNPFEDTSPLVAKTVRMESCGTVITDITKAYGVDVRVDLWMPGDDQPDAWAGLDQPTYVFTAKDRSQIEGPTKTVLDSVIRTTVDLGGSFFGGENGIIQAVPGMDGQFQAPLLGINFVPPWAILIAPEPGEKGSVVDCKISFHTPAGWQHIVGGRSPKWLNDIMNATFAWLIDSLSILIGITGIPSNLLEGFLNNAFLAFQMMQHYERRNAVGPYHPGIETFTATQSAPYNIETLFGFLNKLWDTRGYVSAMATFRNGEVYTYGKDVFRGGLMSVLYMGRRRLFTDYVENVMFRITPTERDILVQIGDGKAEEAPLAKHQRFLTGIFESINVITLAPDSGGLA